jgi:predicted porin
MEGMLFARWTEEDESDGQGDGHDETEYNLGAGITWEASSRLTLRLTAGLTAVQEEDTEDDHEEFNVKLAANYDLTDTMSLWASYEYTREDEGTPNEGYVENLFRMRLTKQW